MSGLRDWFRGKESSNPSSSSDDVSENRYSTIGSYGLQILRDPQDPVVDIYFIHGLTGNRETTWTWTGRGRSCFWPKDLLPGQVCRARISTYGYDADYSTFWRMPTQNRIADHAKNLVTDLVNMRDESNTSNLPIIFVVHSLGGLVLKRALIASNTTLETHKKQILESTLAITFLGTPHYGADKAKWASLANKFTSVFKSANRSIIQVLEPDSEVLAEIESDFSTLIRGRTQNGKRDLNIVCFYEELEVRFIGFIVPKHSAVLGGYETVGIHSNHMDMTKFEHVNDLGYMRVCSEISRWVRRIMNELSEEQSVLLHGLSMLCQRGRDGIKEPYPSTLEWVWDDQISGLPTWLNSHGPSIFWIRGKPGSGKSTLINYLSTRLKHRLILNPNMTTIVATFYFDSQDSSRTSATSLLRTLSYNILKQLSPQVWRKLPELAEPVNRYDEYRGDRRQWAFADISKLFKSILSLNLESIAIILFIDALDECTDYLWELIDLLNELGRKVSFNMRICITSRPLPTLLHSLLRHRELRLEEQTKNDISAFIRGKLDSLKMAPSVDISSKADGVFLWADLIMIECRKAIEDGDLGTETELREKLTKMPNTLKEFYTRIMNRLDKEYVDECRRILCLVACAARPLSISEAWLLLAPSASSNRPSTALPLREYDKFERRLQSRCGGLVELTTSGSLRFIHETVREFLDGSRTSVEMGCITWSINAGHQMLLEECLRYFETPNLCLPNRLLYGDRFDIHSDLQRFYDQFPLLRYAVTNWIQHWSECETTKTKYSEYILLQWSQSENFWIWMRLFNSSNDFSIEHYADTDLFYLAVENNILEYVQRKLHEQPAMNLDINVGRERHYLLGAVARGLRDMTNLLLQHGACASSVGLTHESGLHLAVRRKSKCLIRLLKEHGADPKIPDWNGDTALILAVKASDLSMTKELLCHDLDINDKNRGGCNALSLAVWLKNEDIVQILVEKGADPDSKDRLGRTPLLLAVKYSDWNGQLFVVKLLLERGVEIDSKDERDQTPLLWAAKNGKGSVVILLLQYGASLDAKDLEGRTPLSWAAGNGKLSVVILLLENGAEVDSKDVFGRTPLSRAAGNGKLSVAEFLLEKGVEIDSKDERGRMPLSWAAEKGQLSIIKLLLQYEANLDAKDLEGRTPLSRAAGKGELSVVILLLENGAEVDPKDLEGQTPLSRAAGNGELSVVILLLENGAKVDPKDIFGQTPLSRAARNGKLSVVELLLENSAKADSEDEFGRTPLSWAAGEGNLSIVKLLLEKGVAANSKDKLSLTPLLRAVSNRYLKEGPSTIKLLIEKGVEADCKDNSGRTPLSWAAEKGDLSTVKLLIEKGVEADCKDNSGRTPLSRAAEAGNTSIVKLLLEKSVKADSKDRLGRTPLLWVMRNRHWKVDLSIVKLLLERGVEVDSKDERGRTPLSWAAEKGELSIVKLLLQFKANLDAKDLEGRTPRSWLPMGV